MPYSSNLKRAAELKPFYRLCIYVVRLWWALVVGDGMLFAIDLCCQHFNYYVCKYARLHFNYALHSSRNSFQLFI